MSHHTEITLIKMTNSTLQLVSGIANVLLAVFYVKRKPHSLSIAAKGLNSPGFSPFLSLNSDH